MSYGSDDRKIRQIMSFELSQFFEETFLNKKEIIKIGSAMYLNIETSCNDESYEIYSSINEIEKLNVKNELVEMFKEIYNHEIDDTDISEIENSFEFVENRFLISIKIDSKNRWRYLKGCISINLDEPEIHNNKDIIELFEEMSMSEESGMVVYCEDSIVELRGCFNE